MTTPDTLAGRELDEAVCAALGLQPLFGEPDTAFHKNLGAAMGLLLSVTDDEWQIDHYDGGIGVYSGKGFLLASGPKSEAATTICRAFLKLKERVTT